MKKHILLLCVLSLVLTLSACSNQLPPSVTDDITTDITTPYIATPYSSEDCIGKDYTDIRKAFSDAGYLNISEIKEEDLKSADAASIGTVASISIGGETAFAKGQNFDKNDEVVIHYHALKKHTVTVHIVFLSNLLFNTEDVNFLVDDETVGKLDHGVDMDFVLQLDDGEHILSFVNVEYPDDIGTVNLLVDCDIEVEYEIDVEFSAVAVETKYVDKLLELAPGEVKTDMAAADYYSMNYKDAAKALESLGFTNIKYEALYDIFFGWTDEGAVKSVTINGNGEFSRGTIFNANDEVVITYHMPEEDDPSYIKMPLASEDYDGMNYLEVEQALKDLGFTNIITYSSTSSYHNDGEVFSVAVNRHSFDAGDAFKADEKITIDYYILEKPVVVETININNNDQFAALMKITDQTDAATIRTFANAHIGDIIEFDGCVAFMMRHEDYKTRFNICLVGGDYEADRVYGPLFSFEDVNFYDMNVDGTDTVAEGMNFHITAEIRGYNAEGNYIILEPVSMTLRQASSETPKKPSEEPTKEVDTAEVVLPPSGSKLAKDLDSKGKTTVYYINIDGMANKPMLKKWGSATVTDGVAEYLDYLENLGFKITITDTSSKEPYSGFHVYETNFKVSNSEISWTMFLIIQEEDFVEYELDIHLS